MNVYETRQILEPAVTDFHNADMAIAGQIVYATQEAIPLGNEAYQSLDQSLGALATYATKSFEASKNAQEALKKLKGVQAPGSLTLNELYETKNRVAKAQDLFSEATEAAAAAVPEALKASDWLKQGRSLLDRYTKSSNEVVEGAQRAAEHTRRAKTAVDQAFGEASVESIPRETTVFAERVTELVTNAMEANDYVVSDVGDGDTETDSHQLNTFIDNLGVSLNFMQSARDRSLDTFTAMIQEANNRISLQDIRHLEDLAYRIKQGIATHKAVGEEGERLGGVADGLRVAVLNYIQHI